MARIVCPSLPVQAAAASAHVERGLIGGIYYYYYYYYKIRIYCMDNIVYLT